jgi:hypothetical protein
MGRTVRRQVRRVKSDEWGGLKPKNKKGHKTERANVRKALRRGDDPEDIE